MKYKVQENKDDFIKEIKDDVYNIDQSVYNWFENYNDRFKEVLDPQKLFKVLDFNNIKKLPEEYWVDIIRVIMISIGFACDNVYIFGSVATGKTDKDSDLDLAVEGCPAGSYIKMYGKIINITEHNVDLINLDKEQDKFVKYLKSRKEGELIRVTKG